MAIESYFLFFRDDYVTLVDTVDIFLQLIIVKKTGRVMNQKICYCYDYTKTDISDDVIKNKGESSILKFIAEEKRKGDCECTTHHPEKR
ncbi:MAG: hypothetical protein DRG80_01515 [Deltaproteobacteria bacterium]|nr:MAG: hypothetical protein DRG80_01515 [Deltaproteobacteria bacterium]